MMKVQIPLKLYATLGYIMWHISCLTYSMNFSNEPLPQKSTVLLVFCNNLGKQFGIKLETKCSV